MLNVFLSVIWPKNVVSIWNSEEDTENRESGGEGEGGTDREVPPGGVEEAASTCSSASSSSSASLRGRDKLFLKGILPSLQRLPNHAKEHMKFQIYKWLHDPNSYYNPELLNLDNQFGPFGELVHWGDNRCREWSMPIFFCLHSRTHTHTPQ